jgi:hypothetical protein
MCERCGVDSILISGQFNDIKYCAQCYVDYNDDYVRNTLLKPLAIDASGNFIYGDYGFCLSYETVGKYKSKYMCASCFMQYDAVKKCEHCDTLVPCSEDDVIDKCIKCHPFLGY